MAQKQQGDDQEQSQNPQQGSGQQSIGSSFSKGMNRDLADSAMSPDMYYMAVNASISLSDGNMMGLNTEPMNQLILRKSPLVLIGREYLTTSQYITFWTDNTVSEIGIFTDSTGTYQVLINDSATIVVGLPGMGFKTTNLITCSVRRGFDCGFDCYWSDGRLNPDRMLNTATCPFNTADPNLLPNPWFQTVTTILGCNTYTNTDTVDIRQLLLEPQFNVPCLTLAHSSQSGVLQNGKYQVAMAYTINGAKATDYIALSNPSDIWSHVGEGGGLTLTLSNLELITFREMEIVVISFVNQNVQAKRLGFYATTQTTIYIDNISNSLYTIALQDIPVTTPGIISSDAIYSISNYLCRVGTTERPDINYQPLANQIVAKWVCVEYPDTYYHNGGLNGFPMNVGSMRGEVYAYYLRWRYTTGDVSASYPLVGPLTGPTFSSGGPSVGDGGVTICSGTFDTYHSLETYPASLSSVWNANIPGHPEWDVCGQPIRWFKFPDQTSFPGPSGQLLSHFWNYGTYNNPSMTIRVMGVTFSNIQPPVDLNGNLVPDIQGYEILRATRDGNSSILAKGQVNHMRGYVNADGTTGLYQNYPYDDLHADRYLTSSQTIGTVGGAVDRYPGGQELIDVLSDIVSFHSPETSFQQPFLGLGFLDLIQIHSGQAVGQFYVPYKHPMFKLVTDNVSYLSATIGVLVGLMSLITAATGGNDFGLVGTSDLPINIPLGFGNIPDLSVLGTNAPGAVVYGIVAGFSVAIALIMAPITAKVVSQQILNVINGLVPNHQYARQYDSHGFYNVPYPTSKTTIAVNDYDYILGQEQEFAGQTINNLYRNNYVALSLAANIPPFSGFPDPVPQIPGVGSANFQNYNAAVGLTSLPISGAVDCSRFTLGQCPNNNNSQPFYSPIMSWYGAYRVSQPSQYGQVDSPKQVPISCMQVIVPGVRQSYSTGVLFGGDTYINRYTEKNPMLFFNDWLWDAPPDIQYDYTQYENVPYPRYWANNSKIYYDFWSQASRNWHMDEVGPSTVAGAFWLKDGFFYLFNNGVRDFYVESTVNVAYRDYGDTIPQQFYNPYGFTDLEQMFRSDRMRDYPVNFYKYDYSLSANRFWNQWLSWSQCLRVDYDPQLAYSCFAYYPRRVNYSLPQSEEQAADNWRIFLPNNYKDFPAPVTGIEPYSNTGALFLMQDAAPWQVPGVESIPSSSGTDYNTGTGALFAQQLQAVSNAGKALQFGSCQGRFGVVNTPYGIFWISQNTGKILQYAPNKTFFNQGESVVDIAIYGMKYWLSLYLPSQLLRLFPTFPLYDNPVAGVGVQLSYDNTTEILYITKRDWVPQPGVQVTYSNGQWYGGCPPGTKAKGVDPLTGQHLCTACLGGIKSCPGTPITLGDPKYFQNASWTLSFDPKDKKFVSFHKWNPGLMISGERHIFSTDPTGESLWEHNNSTTGWCNYYGIQYMFQLEVPINSGLENTCIENLEIVMDSFSYMANEVDKFNTYADFFNEAQVFNEEQSTLPLVLVERPLNNPFGALAYPFITAAGNNILFTKVENKFRFSIFRDFCNDRGQLTPTNIEMKTTQANGFEWLPNLAYFDFFKSPFQLKKIRHRASRVFLQKSNITTNSLSILSIKSNIVKSFR